MKKIISAILVLVVLAGIGYGVWTVYDHEVLSNPEKQIIGEWKTENELFYFTFNEDGTVSGKIDLPIIGDASINGTYTLDRETEELTITYSIGSLSYNDKNKFSIAENVLTITNEKTDIQTVYYRHNQ